MKSSKSTLTPARPRAMLLSGAGQQPPFAQTSKKDKTMTATVTNKKNNAKPALEITDLAFLPKNTPGKVLGEARTVPLSAITFDEDFNGRKRYDGIKELWASLNAEGQNQAITCWKKEDGTLYAVDGFRRGRAFHHGCKEKNVDPGAMPVLVNVKEYANEKEAMLANAGAEGTVEPWRLYDVVARVGQLVKLGAKAPEIARHVGKSESHVKNCTSMCNELIPAILNLWKDGKLPHGGKSERTSGELSFSEAQRIATKFSREDQEKWLKDQTSLAAGIDLVQQQTPPVDGDPPVDPPDPPALKPGAKKIKAALAELNGIPADARSAVVTGKIVALMWVLGDIESINQNQP